MSSQLLNLAYWKWLISKRFDPRVRRFSDSWRDFWWWDWLKIYVLSSVIVSKWLYCISYGALEGWISTLDREITLQWPALSPHQGIDSYSAGKSWKYMTVNFSTAMKTSSDLSIQEQKDNSTSLEIDLTYHRTLWSFKYILLGILFGHLRNLGSALSLITFLILNACPMCSFMGRQLLTLSCCSSYLSMS